MIFPYSKDNMSIEFEEGTSMMWRNKLGTELRETSLYGQRRDWNGVLGLKEGIEADETKIEVVEKLPPQSIVEEIQVFLDTSGFKEDRKGLLENF